MRNLKLRAWLKEDKEMISVDELAFDTKWVRGFYKLASRWFRLEQVELMSSTGLFDAFSTEIFEGDIITKNQGETFGIVRYGICHSSLCFYVEQNYKGSSLTYPINPNHSRYYKVVGNIYENADLLGKEESDKGTVAELQVKGAFDKKSERWYIDTDEVTVEAMNSFLKEHDLDVFESWLGYLEGGMSDESLAFINILQTIENEIELADGSKIKLVEG